MHKQFSLWMMLVLHTHRKNYINYTDLHSEGMLKLTGSINLKFLVEYLVNIFLCNFMKAHLFILLILQSNITLFLNSFLQAIAFCKDNSRKTFINHRFS